MRGKGLAINLALNSQYGILAEDLVTIRNLLQSSLQDESVEYGRVYAAQGGLWV